MFPFPSGIDYIPPTNDGHLPQGVTYFAEIYATLGIHL